jgi:hydrogenase expression/formation protein HypD
VSIITGVEAYERIPMAGRAAVITGFEPADVAEGILMLLRQIMEGRFEVAIQYVRGPKAEGNLKAREVMAEVFEPGDAEWRGLGVIPGSGLRIRCDYEGFDTLKRFSLPEISSVEFRGCRCGQILRGVMAPAECHLFMKACTPANPVGPCMVSGEGTCAAYYKYERSDR